MLFFPKNLKLLWIVFFLQTILINITITKDNSKSLQSKEIKDNKSNENNKTRIDFSVIFYNIAPYNPSYEESSGDITFTNTFSNTSDYNLQYQKITGDITFVKDFTAISHSKNTDMQKNSPAINAAYDSMNYIGRNIDYLGIPLKINPPKQISGSEFRTEEEIIHVNNCPNYIYYSGRALSATAENIINNSVEVVTKDKDSFFFFQSYNNKDIVYLPEYLGKVFTIFLHKNNGNLKSFHIIFNNSFGEKINFLFPGRFFHNPIPSKDELIQNDKIKNNKSYTFIPKKNLHLVNFFINKNFPFAVTMDLDNVHNYPIFIFYFYLTFYKDDVTKVEVIDTGSNKNKKVLKMKNGYILKLYVNFYGRVLQGVVSANFITRNFNKIDVIKNVLSRTSQVGDEIHSIIEKTKLFDMIGEKVSFKISVLLNHHLYNDCKNNFSMNIWFIDDKSIIRYANISKCCSKRYEGFLD